MEKVRITSIGRTALDGGAARFSIVYETAPGAPASSLEFTSATGQLPFEEGDEVDSEVLTRASLGLA